jgi:hypothetical protein
MAVFEIAVDAPSASRTTGVTEELSVLLCRELSRETEGHADPPPTSPIVVSSISAPPSIPVVSSLVVVSANRSVVHLMLALDAPSRRTGSPTETT